jgi:hypothetical protein
MRDGGSFGKAYFDSPAAFARQKLNCFRLAATNPLKKMLISIPFRHMERNAPQRFPEDMFFIAKYRSVCENSVQLAPNN